MHYLAEMAKSLMRMADARPRSVVPLTVAARNLLVMAEAELMLSDSMMRRAAAVGGEGVVTNSNPQELISQLRDTNRDLYDILRYVESLDQRRTEGDDEPATLETKSKVARLACEEMLKLAASADDLGDVALADEVDSLLGQCLLVH